MVQKFPESATAKRWLAHLKGIEIGPSAHNPFGLNARFIGRSLKQYQDEERRICGETTLLDIEADAHDIPLESESEDYVLSSHVIEHCPDVIRTLIEWYRVLKPGGLLFMITPLRDASASDRGRSLTTWDHLFDDFRDQVTPETHAGGGTFLLCHYHVFSIETMQAFISQIFGERLQLLEAQERDDKVGNGFTLVYRKLRPLHDCFPWQIRGARESLRFDWKPMLANPELHSV